MKGFNVIFCRIGSTLSGNEVHSVGKNGDFGSLKYILAQLFACVIVQIAFCHFFKFLFSQCPPKCQ